MITTKITKILQEIGLNDNEAKIYTTSLSLGLTTVQKISRASEIKRSTTYDVIDSLKQKGLMRIEVAGFKRKFAAESPEKLERILEQRHSEFRSQLPDLMNLYSNEQTGSILKYYEGAESVKNVYTEMIQDIKPGEDYMIISTGKDVFDTYGEWFEKFSEKRSKLNIRVRALIQDTEWAQQNNQLEQIYNMEVKVLPEMTTLTTNTVITPQRILMNQITPLVSGIVIENKSVIHTQQEMFELLWNSVE